MELYRKIQNIMNNNDRYVFMNEIINKNAISKIKNLVDECGNTLLLHALKNPMKLFFIKALIETGEFDLGYVGEFGKTALIYACIHDLNAIAHILIASGKSKPEHVDTHGYDALFYICSKLNMEDVALALIATKQCNTNLGKIYVFLRGNHLHVACNYNNTKIALALIETGMPIIGQYYNNADLMCACKYNNIEIAIAILKTGYYNFVFNIKLKLNYNIDDDYPVECLKLFTFMINNWNFEIIYIWL